jgi:signal transduction histidine kinase/ligand-binding sensor domain-containing protein
MDKGHRQRRAVVALGILLACCACAFAMDPSLDINQYAHTAWKVRDGFVGSEINSIAQTPDGYIWLATQFGLFRFDGVRNVPWQPPRDQHLPPGTIFSLLVDRGGTLWIGAKGLASFKDSKLTHYPELDGHYIFKILEDHEGTVWASGVTDPIGKLCAIRNGNIQCYGGDGTLGLGALSLYEDSKGNLWAGVLNGLWQWKPGPPKFHSLAGEPDGIRAFAEDTDGTLLVGWKGGIYRFVDGKTEPYSLRSASQQFRAKRMLRDRNGALWIGTPNRGLLHVHEGRTDVFGQSDGLSGEGIESLFEDRENNIWVGTSNGLDRFRDFAVVTLTQKQGLSSAIVAAVLPDREGNIWLSTPGDLDRWNSGQTKTYRIHPESLLQDDRGRIWTSTSREFGYLEDGRFTSIEGVPGGNILSIAQDTEGNLWVANEPVGLLRISPQNEIREIPWAGLGHKEHASVVAADRRQGGLWIGFFLGGIAYFSDGQVRASYTTTDGLGAGRVSDFRFDDDGTLWVSTEGGLSRLKNNRVATLTRKNGLPCDAVHWAMEDDDRSFWLYTACGLVRIARSELDAWVADPNRTIRVAIFDSSDGVRSLSSPGHYHPQVAKTPDGKLWFLPWDGVSVIDPHHIPFNTIPPPVHVEQVVADDKAYEISSGLRLPAQTRHLEIDYTALSFVAPEKVLFRFKLEGQDRDWRDVGTRRQAFYTNLSPGNYRFRVAACNNSGVWNEAGTFLDFSVAPAYYQTNWFLALCAAGFLGLLWGIYRLRIQQLQHQFAIGLEARVNERTRIARELHDTLLQTFHGLMFQFQAASNLMLRRPEEAKHSLDDAIDETKKALAESRDAIQGLRSGPIAEGNIAELLMSTSRELADADGSEHQPVFDLVEEGERRTLSPTVSSDICRIALELMRNAYQHAHARRIEAEIRYGDSMFRLRVRDDGKGIEPKVLKEGGRVGHWGLRGLRERADRIGAHLDLWSEPGRGTEVQLLIPASVAYESFRDSYRAKLVQKVKSRAQRS